MDVFVGNCNQASYLRYSILVSVRKSLLSRSCITQKRGPQINIKHNDNCLVFPESAYSRENAAKLIEKGIFNLSSHNSANRFRSLSKRTGRTYKVYKDKGSERNCLDKSSVRQ